MRWLSTAALLVLLSTTPALAQDPPKDPTPPETAPPTQPLSPNNPESPTNPRRPIWQLAKDIGSDFTRLPTWDSAVVLAIGGGAAALVHPVDPDVNPHLVGRGWTKDVFLPGKALGYAWFQGGVGAATYLIGKAIDGPKTTHIGVDLLRAQIVTGVLTEGLKFATQRERPDGSNTHSFPSGHASVTFASATVLARHFGWKGYVTYAASSYVAASRLRDNRHYLSDVIFGAAVGTIAGRTVTRHGRNTWTFSPVPVSRGIGFTVIKK
jgi:membrane-associated phospholipid phosphatase